MHYDLSAKSGNASQYIVECSAEMFDTGPPYAVGRLAMFHLKIRSCQSAQMTLFEPGVCTPHGHCILICSTHTAGAKLGSGVAAGKDKFFAYQGDTHTPFGKAISYYKVLIESPRKSCP